MDGGPTGLEHTSQASKQTKPTRAKKQQVGRDCTSRSRDWRTLMTPVSVTQLAT